MFISSREIKHWVISSLKFGFFLKFVGCLTPRMTTLTFSSGDNNPVPFH